MELFNDYENFGHTRYFTFTGNNANYSNHINKAECLNAEMEYSIDYLTNDLVKAYAWHQEGNPTFPAPSKDFIKAQVTEVIRFFWINEEETEEYEACQGITAEARENGPYAGHTFITALAAELGAPYQCEQDAGQEGYLDWMASRAVLRQVERAWSRMNGK